MCHSKNSLAHTKWDCKYHLVFAPKYRRQVIYKDIKADVGQILGTLCRRKGIEIIEAQCMPDHIHMLVSIPPKYSVSDVVSRVHRPVYGRAGEEKQEVGLLRVSRKSKQTSKPLLGQSRSKEALNMPF